jgi:hypothetical protein
MDRLLSKVKSRLGWSLPTSTGPNGGPTTQQSTNGRAGGNRRLMKMTVTVTYFSGTLELSVIVSLTFLALRDSLNCRLVSYDWRGEKVTSDQSRKGLPLEESVLVLHHILVMGRLP